MVEQTKQGQPKLTVRVELAPVESGEAVILCPSGRVDGSTVGILDGAVQERIDAGAGVLIFDFEETSYISSAGLRVLLMSARKMQSGGGKAVFCGLLPHIAEVFEISGFSAILDIRASRAQALESV